MEKKSIIAICGSASRNSANLAILNFIAASLMPEFNVTVIDDLTVFPHFQTELTNLDVPAEVVRFRELVAAADGVLICTPEYVFSLPSGLKNLLEWCVSTTVFSDKPTGLITASASGEKGHEALKLIMTTIQAVFEEQTTLLIQGVRGKVTEDGRLSDESTVSHLERFSQAFKALIEKSCK